MTALYNLFSRHHIRPGEFYDMSQGEQLMLIAFSDMEIELEEKMRKEARRGGK